jgi:hypothetical protein
VVKILLIREIVVLVHGQLEVRLTAAFVHPSMPQDKVAHPHGGDSPIVGLMPSSLTGGLREHLAAT